MLAFPLSVSVAILKRRHCQSGIIIATRKGEAIQRTRSCFKFTSRAESDTCSFHVDYLPTLTKDISAKIELTKYRRPLSALSGICGKCRVFCGSLGKLKPEVCRAAHFEMESLWIVRLPRCPARHGWFTLGRSRENPLSAPQ
jgi:hypothetical protein